MFSRVKGELIPEKGKVELTSFSSYANILQLITIIFSVLVIIFTVKYIINFGAIMTNLTFGTVTISSLLVAIVLLITSTFVEGGIVGRASKIEGGCEVMVIFSMLLFYVTQHILKT